MDKIAKINESITLFYVSRLMVSKDLVDSIFYSIDGGGKRIRPIIFLEMLEGFGLELSKAHFDVAAALEMIHTGSLIHDDLPAMDNDDYRRGRLTNHKKFDEATAILAGDSLFLDPFGLIAEANLSAEIKLALISELSFGSGTFGMVGGQMLDMKGEEQYLSLEELKTIHANKTGKLLAFPFVAAGIIAEKTQSVLDDLRLIGEIIGLAFQVRDDILDITASFEELGKTPQKDLVAEKSTYPSFLGLKKSYELLDDSLDKAVSLVKQLEKENGFNSARIVEMIERLRLHG